MANHHIISHTGVVSTWELLRGAVNTFNLGFDMALLTVIAATLSGGDPVTWTLSIGGPDPRVEAPLGGLLGLLGALFFSFPTLSRALSHAFRKMKRRKEKKKSLIR